MKLYLMLAMSFTILLCAAPALTMGDDYTDAKAAREGMLRKLKARYVKLAGRQPTIENLLESLKIEKAVGKQAGEVIAALGLISHDEGRPATAAEAILACYQGNPGYWLGIYRRSNRAGPGRKIRVACRIFQTEENYPRYNRLPGPSGL